MLIEESRAYQIYNSLLPYMEEIKKICLPFLNQYKLDHFWYNRAYMDGSFIDLGIDPAWFKYMIEHDYYDVWNELRFYQDYWPKDETKFISTPRDFFEGISTETLNIVTHKYKIFYVFNILINKKNYLENFAFSAPLENYESLSVYSRKFGILKSFGAYFTQKAASIIQHYELHGKIFFPVLNPFSSPKALDTLLCPNKNISEDWVRTNLKSFFLAAPDRQVTITPRQRECLLYFAQGASHKEIAKILKIEPKTIEAHLSTIKDKTGLRSRSALIQAFIESGL